MEITVTINGERKRLEIAIDDLLLDILRREGYFGVKRGCGMGSCGSCIVLLNGVPVNSCLILAANVDGEDIVTIEGVKGEDGELHPVQKALLESGAVQCGYCTPGMVLSAISILDKNPNPSREEIIEGLSGNLCRCTGYVKIIEAIQKVSKGMDGKKRSKGCQER